MKFLLPIIHLMSMYFKEVRMKNNISQNISSISSNADLELFRNRNEVRKRHGKFRYETNLKYKNKRKEVNKFS